MIRFLLERQRIVLRYKFSLRRSRRRLCVVVSVNETFYERARAFRIERRVQIRVEMETTPLFHIYGCARAGSLNPCVNGRVASLRVVG